MGANKGILQGWLIIYLLTAGSMTTVGLIGYGMSRLVTSAHASSFYPACLKPDGDWLHGVSRKECIGKDVRGRWVTNRALKKARRVM